MIMFYILTNLLPVLLLSVIGRCHTYDGSILHEPACNFTVIGSGGFVVSCNFSNNDFKIDANAMPSDLYEFEITSGGNIVFESRSFSRLWYLDRISVRNVANLILRRESFLNLSTSHLKLEVSNTGSVEIESRSFYLLRGPVTYKISKCSYLTIHSDAVPWIHSMHVQDVKHVKLSENSLSHQAAEKMAHNHDYNTTITMQKVSLEELPRNSFPFPAAIKLHECEVGIVRKNAFSAVELLSVHIRNSTFEVMETEAFSGKSLLESLQLTNMHISQMRTGAILSAVTDFKFSNSNIDLVEEEAFNMSTTVKIHLLNNVFRRVKEKGITLRSWTLKIENNTFRDLNSQAINMPRPEDGAIDNPRTLHFVGNILEELTEHSLRLDATDDIELVVKENIFIRPCHCDWRDYLKTLIDSSTSRFVDAVFIESYCAINSAIAQCFKYSKNFMRMANFTEQVCNTNDTIVCLQRAETGGKSTSENPNIVKAIGILNEQKEDRERKVIGAVVAVALGGVLVMTLLSLCMWFNRKGKLRTECLISSVGNALLSAFSRLTISNDLVRSTSAHSITRVSVHEYAEVGPQKLLPGEADENVYECEDKATQTLPEELTQELLQSLREKLDDPENYKEARNMIEHLYDLIKVEECCNNNVLNEEFGDINLANNEPGESENVYDVIKSDTRQRIRRYDKSFKTLAHKGTRVPSPDKLSPQTFTTSSFSSLTRESRRDAMVAVAAANPSITEYMEPSDRRSYIYTELLYDQCTSSASETRSSLGIDMLTEYKEPRDFKVPIYSELADIIHRPLPTAPTDNQVSSDNVGSPATQS